MFLVVGCARLGQSIRQQNHSQSSASSEAMSSNETTEN